MTDPTPQVPRPTVPTFTPRRPLVAALLSILLAGLGQLYSGRPIRGAAVFAFVVLADLIVLALGVRLAPRLQLPVIVIGLLVVVAVATVDAARTAASAGSSYRKHRYNHWYVYAGILVVFTLVVEPALIHWMNAHVVEAFRIASGAMQPTLKEGDYVFVVPTTEIRRGDVVVHERGGQRFLHRAIGLPRDTVEMRSGEMLINGARYAEPYAEPVRETENVQLAEAKWQRRYLVQGSDTSLYRPTMKDWGPIVIPAASYFVLGDNRGESSDSRALGFVPGNSIRARATTIYFSRDPDRGIRWDRVGLAVQ
jgi:signal peptidase I